ncbi:unnamed protein product [Prunus armeniaca]
MHPFGVKVLCIGVNGCLFHQFAIGRPIAVVDQIAELRCSEAAFESAKGCSVIGLWAPRVFMAESGSVFSKRLIVSLPNGVKVVGEVKAISLYRKMIEEDLF